jgi:hypothetical protein
MDIMVGEAPRFTERGNQFLTRCRGYLVRKGGPSTGGELSLNRGLVQVGKSDNLEEQVLQILWCLLQGSYLGSSM